MYTNLLIILTVLICILAVVAVMEFMALAKANKWDLTGLIKSATDIYGTAATIAAALEPFLPAPYSGILKLIFTDAEKAVTAAEQAYKAGICAKADRKAKATELIENTLAIEGITVDNKIKQLIDVATEIMVNTLPKSKQIIGFDN